MKEHCCEHSHHHHCDEHEHCHSCGCEHSHSDVKRMTLRLIAGAILAAAAIAVQAAGYVSLALIPFLLSYLILGGDVLLTAVKNIFRGKIFDENFLMTIATLGAFYLGERIEGCAIMLFYQIGEMISHNAAEKSEASISALMDIRPDTAQLVGADGQITETPCAEIHPGDIISAAAGERVAFDGIIETGGANFDTSSLTGEAIPRGLSEGNTVLSGMICLDRTVKIRVTKEFGDSTLSRILDLAKNARDKKSSAERFITSFARIYTPLVVLAAALVAIVPSLLGFLTPEVWITRALTFLVISCPCALVVSVPLTFFAGIGCGSMHGILIKNSLALENLARVKTAAFDKTGTITRGEPILTEIRANGAKAILLEYAALAECDSTHPIATAIKKAYAAAPDRTRISDVAEIPARGVSAIIDGKRVLVGCRALLLENGIDAPDAGKSAVYVAADGKYFGYIGIGDEIKPDTDRVISSLHKMGIKTMLLSGDSNENAAKAAQKVGIESVRGGLLPQDKLAILENTENSLFAGDGINDAPALAAASVGAAMGVIGSDAAIESADVVIMGDELSHIPEAIHLARGVMRIVYQNVWFSLGVKFAIMILSFFGIGGMWPAIFADVGVCVLAVMNAFRAFRINISL